jgi:AraC-like DNA-binding protein/quercetin dioxygenase-like cupin family protein
MGASRKLHIQSSFLGPFLFEYGALIAEPSSHFVGQAPGVWYTSSDMLEALYQPFPMAGQARAQIWRYAPEFHRPRHVHAEPELNLIASGTGTFGVGEANLSVSAGDLLWWLPGQDHELVWASADFDLFVVGLTPELSCRVLGGTLGSAYGGPARVRLGPDALARFCARCAAPVGPGDTAVVERHVGDLWSDAHAVRTSVPDKHALTRRALAAFLHRADLGRSDVAHGAHSNPSEVSRHFRRDVGLTLTTYRTRLRLLKFIGGAEDGARTLLSASLAAGFGSYSQCHRAFQRTFGCTPRSFFRRGVSDDMRDAFLPQS